MNPSRRRLMIRAAVSVATGLVIGLVVFVLTPLSFLLSLAVWGVATGMIALYLHFVDKEIDKRVPKYQWQVDVVPDPEGMWISRKLFLSICHVLNQSIDAVPANTPFTYVIDPGTRIREDQVLLVTRRHWMLLVVRTAPIVVPTIGLSFMIGVVDSYVPWRLWWIIPIVMIIGAIGSWIASIEWLSTITMVTRDHYWVIYSPPPWLPHLNVSKPNMSLTEINSLSHKAGSIGGLCGFGTLTLNTSAQLEALEVKQPYIPHHEKVVNIIQTAQFSDPSRFQHRQTN